MSEPNSETSVPYRNYPGISQHRAREFAEFLRTSHNGPVVATENYEATARITQLNWDSGLLHLNCGRVDDVRVSAPHADALARAIAHAADLQKLQHLTARCDAADLFWVHALGRVQLEIVDALITFVRTCAPELPNIANTGPSFDLATFDDADEIGELGRNLFKLDRFHTDPRIATSDADALHAEWCRNSVLGIAADAVVVVRMPQGIAGFVTCKIVKDSLAHLGAQLGTIVLVGTAPWAQGQGVGKLVTAAAMNWFASQGCSLVEVGTQLSNIRAARLYESSGFRAAQASFTLRRYSA